MPTWDSWTLMCGTKYKLSDSFAVELTISNQFMITGNSITEPIFNDQAVASIGAVAIQQSNPDVI